MYIFQWKWEIKFFESSLNFQSGYKGGFIFFSKNVMPSYPGPTGIICDAYLTSVAEDDNFHSNCPQYRNHNRDQASWKAVNM